MARRKGNGTTVSKQRTVTMHATTAMCRRAMTPIVVDAEKLSCFFSRPTRNRHFSDFVLRAFYRLSSSIGSRHQLYPALSSSCSNYSYVK